MDEETNKKNNIEFLKGTSLVDAFVIETEDSWSGVACEYKKLKEIHPIHKITLQSVTENNNKFYDVFEIDLPNEEKTKVYFDISNFYGK